jgi:uncharacterized protein (DUF58 family)
VGKGVYVSATDLAALEADARHLVFRPRQPTHNLLAGRHGSRLRGRGLDFDELRQYLPGDDVRAIDWHVTARMPRPFVRLYTEEKDRPAIVVVDQRINMFFGTKLAMKSVTAAEAAALCAWRALGDGDRVGGIVFDDEALREQRPERSRGALLRFLARVAEDNAALHAGTAARRNPAQFDAALDRAARIATRDHLVIIVSDCDGQGPETRDLLRRLTLRNDVVLFLVYDPFLHALPPARELIASDGELQVEVPTATERVRQSIATAADRWLKEILELRHEIGINVAPLSTAENTAAQLRHLIGARASARQGVS